MRSFRGLCKCIRVYVKSASDLPAFRSPLCRPFLAPPPVKSKVVHMSPVSFSCSYIYVKRLFLISKEDERPEVLLAHRRRDDAKSCQEPCPRAGRAGHTLPHSWPSFRLLQMKTCSPERLRPGREQLRFCRGGCVCCFPPCSDFIYYTFRLVLCLSCRKVQSHQMIRPSSRTSIG